MAKTPTAKKPLKPKGPKPKGIYCLVCLGTAWRVSHTRSPCPGKRVRYLRCLNPACGARRKTTEK